MTCYDSFSTLVAAGRNMATKDGYIWQPHAWREVHPDFDARRVIEWSYLVETHRNDPEVQEQAKKMLEQARAKWPAVARRNNPTQKFNVAVTYSTATPESREEGDFEDTGFEVEPEPATLEDIVGYAQQYGIGPRDSNDYTYWWDSGGSTTDFGTGEEIQYALHVTKLGAPRGERLDDRTFDRINKILGGKAFHEREANPRRTNNPAPALSANDLVRGLKF